MELIFIVLGGAILGLGARYLLPGRSQHGSVLVPALGTAFAAAVWVLLTWLGWRWDGGWIWVVTLVATAVAVTATDLVLGRRRTRHDEEMLVRLSGGLLGTD